MTKARITHYGTAARRVYKYLCTQCDTPLAVVGDDRESVLVCDGCNVQIGYIKKPLPHVIKGQTELEL